MKFNKTLLFSLFFIILGLTCLNSSTAWAIEFKPNIPIPGSAQFGGDTVTFDQHSGTILALYIRDLYDYGAGLAGVVALFMLIFAGYKWLMAAGSSEKVSAAKSIVNNVLIGLLLLFAGYLLLSQISNRLVNLRGLVVPQVDIVNDHITACQRLSEFMADSYSCGEPISSYSANGDVALAKFIEKNRAVLSTVVCISNSCEASQYFNPTCRAVIYGGSRISSNEPCPVVISPYEDPPTNCECLKGYSCEDVVASAVLECEAYDTNDQGCSNNTCYSATNFPSICTWNYGNRGGAIGCFPLSGSWCRSNDDCASKVPAGGPDYCCAETDYPGSGLFTDDDECWPVSEAAEHGGCGDD